MRIISCVFLLLWAGCSGDGSTLGPDGTLSDGDGDMQPTEAVTLAQLSAEIFTPRCAISGCHSGSFPAGNMSLEASRIASQIIDVASSGKPDEKRIIPGEPDNSYLLKKLRGTSGIVGSQMPLSGRRLTADEIARIARWVEDGAEAN
jgi:hypothetical protein